MRVLQAVLVSAARKKSNNLTRYFEFYFINSYLTKVSKNSFIMEHNSVANFSFQAFLLIQITSLNGRYMLYLYLLTFSLWVLVEEISITFTLTLCASTSCTNIFFLCPFLLRWWCEWWWWWWWCLKGRTFFSD